MRPQQPLLDLRLPFISPIPGERAAVFIGGCENEQLRPLFSLKNYALLSLIGFITLTLELWGEKADRPFCPAQVICYVAVPFVAGTELAAFD